MRSHAVISTVIAATLSLSVCPAARAGEAEVVLTYSHSFNLRIPEDPAYSKGWMADAVIEVPLHVAIEDLDVTVDITHTNAFDLQLFLQSPSGTRVLLNMGDAYHGYYEGANYTSTTFDDEAADPIEDAEPPFQGRFRPIADSSLTAFDGEDPFGPWELQVYDAFHYDTGRLNSFALTITVPEPASAAFLLLGLVGLPARRRR